jgi:uncharacterized Zn finger protein
MTTPCPRCGETKTDPVWHGLMYKLVHAFGYRLHQCARCHAPRFIPRHHEKSHDSSKLGNGPANAPVFPAGGGNSRKVEASLEPKKDRVTAADSSDDELHRCPACGSSEYHRTKRTKLERLRFRPPIARCEGCGMRFPYPGHRVKYPEALKLAGATASGSAEETKAPNMAAENTPPKVTKEGTAADRSDGASPRCPACGSKEYHRTKRTRLEHFRLRPPMARCEKCGMRFPHPGRREKYPEPLKFVGPAATVSGSAEEKKAPGMAEETSGPKVTQPVTVVDYTEHGLRCCPVCGSSKYHRSRRTILDRALLRSKMAHCEKCGSRFPYPRHHDKPSDSVKSGAAANVSQAGEGGVSRCPFCGSPAYRRSRRTTLERLFLRPKMARCRHCRKRFPYPAR